ncbi:unnamed protein product, partial [Prorocentrum cordatum]
ATDAMCCSEEDAAAMTCVLEDRAHADIPLGMGRGNFSRVRAEAEARQLRQGVEGAGEGGRDDWGGQADAEMPRCTGRPSSAESDDASSSNSTNSEMEGSLEGDESGIQTEDESQGQAPEGLGNSGGDDVFLPLKAQGVGESEDGPGAADAR